MKPQTTSSIAVLGAGSWGSAVAMHLSRSGQSVRLWARSEEHVANMLAKRENSRYLPGVKMPDTLMVTSDLAHALDDVSNVCLMVPSSAIAETLLKVRAHKPDVAMLTWGSKGLVMDEQFSFVHELVAHTMGPHCHIGMLSGPTFAYELAHGAPTAIVIASASKGLRDTYQQRFHHAPMRCYTVDDMIGVQLCGAMKNVLAVAAGIGDGLGLGANARSALITRGMAEMTRLGQALGANESTFMGLAGVGDVVLSCTSDQSRNRRLGLALGKGSSLEQAIKSIGQVVESVENVAKVIGLAERHNVDMPIATEVMAILQSKKTPAEGLSALLAREPRIDSVK